jgi:hypothetical protein
MDLSTGLRRIRNKIVGNFTNLYLGQPNPGGSTIGSKSRTGMHSGRRIQQHLDTNSGFQFDVIIGDNIEFAIPDCYFATPTAPLSTDPAKTGSVKPSSRTAKYRASQISRCSVAGAPIGPTTSALPLPNLRTDDDRGLRRPRPHTRKWCGVCVA